MTNRLEETHALKCELASEVLRSMGKLTLRVTGWSMLPTVWPGETLLIDRVSSDQIAVGDIVLFGRDRRLIAHRVVTKPGGTTITQGDGMPQPDTPVSNDNILGKVSFIVRNGRCIEPNQTLRSSQRAVAALVQRSEFAARVIVGVHGLRNPSRDGVASWQS